MTHFLPSTSYQFWHFLYFHYVFLTSRTEEINSGFELARPACGDKTKFTLASYSPRVCLFFSHRLQPRQVRKEMLHDAHATHASPGRATGVAARMDASVIRKGNLEVHTHTNEKRPLILIYIDLFTTSFLFVTVWNTMSFFLFFFLFFFSFTNYNNIISRVWLWKEYSYTYSIPCCRSCS